MIDQVSCHLHLSLAIIDENAGRMVCLSGNEFSVTHTLYGGQMSQNYICK